MKKKQIFILTFISKIIFRAVESERLRPARLGKSYLANMTNYNYKKSVKSKNPYPVLKNDDCTRTVIPERSRPARLGIVFCVVRNLWHIVVITLKSKHKNKNNIKINTHVSNKCTELESGFKSSIQTLNNYYYDNNNFLAN